MPASPDAAQLRPSHPSPQPLRELFDAVPGLTSMGDPGSVQLTGCTHDSRRVLPGDLYAALPGAHVHGAAFVEQARAAGAVAVLTDPGGAGQAVGLPTVVAADPRSVLGPVAAWVHGRPGDELTVIGVTGTNGKTTTAFMVEAGLRAAGLSAALIGTIVTRVGDDVLPKVWITNPEATDLHAMFALMRERGVAAVAMEVSSHALALGRVDGFLFDTAVFTNLSQDHLEFHHTMEDYFAAKASLFTPARAQRGLVNADDEAGIRLLAEPQIPLSAFALDANATWTARDVELGADGSRFRLVGPGVDLQAAVQLPGGFNVSNALAALAALITAGVRPDAAARGIAELAGIPGRMERIDEGQPFTALVDFAHTPEAVHTLLGAVRAITPGRVIVVLGCGGDRDAGKRPLMGRAAVQGADVAVFTSDNPRSEDPSAILAQMGPGAVVEVDRRAAIGLAIAQARPGDCVVVAGKGHETGQEVAGVVTPFDDRQVLREQIQAVLG